MRERTEETTLTLMRRVTEKRPLVDRIAPDHVLRNRHSKTAKGMTRTAYRSGHKLSNDASRLSVRGTTASSAVSLQFRAKRLPCNCCGSNAGGKWALNANGQLRLASLRCKRQRRRS